MALPDKPITRQEQYLSNIAGQGTPLPEAPITREEAYLDVIAKQGGGGGTGDGDMKKSVYDNDLAIQNAGGIKAYVDNKGFITNTVNNLANYYLKSQTYTQAEVDALIAAVKNGRIISVATLPTTDIDTKAIYLVPSADPQTTNIKDEYINIDGTSAGWELIGSTAIDLSGYVTDADLTTALADYTTTANLTTLLAAKQDTISDLATIRSGASAGASAYQKPATGIPKTDLASAVQTSLEKADSAVQDVSGKADTSTAHLTSDTAETDVDDDDYFPFYDTSASGKRKTLWSNIKSVLKSYFDGIYATLSSVAGKADTTLIAPVQTTLTASKAYAVGEQFVYNQVLYKVTQAIAQGATITIGTNAVVAGSVTETVSLERSYYLNSVLVGKVYFYRVGVVKSIAVNFNSNAISSSQTLINDFFPSDEWKSINSDEVGRNVFVGQDGNAQPRCAWISNIENLLGIRAGNADKFAGTFTYI